MIDLEGLINTHIIITIIYDDGSFSVKHLATDDKGRIIERNEINPTPKGIK